MFHSYILIKTFVLHAIFCPIINLNMYIVWYSTKLKQKLFIYSIVTPNFPLKINAKHSEGTSRLHHQRSTSCRYTKSSTCGISAVQEESSMKLHQNEIAYVPYTAFGAPWTRYHAITHLKRAVNKHCTSFDCAAQVHYGYFIKLIPRNNAKAKLRHQNCSINIH